MALTGNGERPGKIRRLEVRQQEHHGPAADDLVEVLQGGGEVRAPAFGLVEEHFPDDPQDVSAALLRRQEKLDRVGEEQEPHLVAVADGAEGEHAGDLGGEFALGLRHAAEAPRRAHVHGEDDGEFALFGEVLDVQVARARGDVAVDEAHLVAGVVRAHVLEVHPAPLEDGVVLPAEGRVDQPPRAQFEAANLFEDSGGVGHLSGGKYQSREPRIAPWFWTGWF